MNDSSSKDLPELTNLLRKRSLGDDPSESRREFLQKATYVAPAILTLSVTPAMAQYASNDSNAGTGSPTIVDGGGKAKGKDKDKGKGRGRGRGRGRG